MSEWQTMRLGDAMELKRGFDLPQQRRVVGKIPIISSSGFSGLHDEAKVIGPGVVTGRYGTIGQVFYVQTDYWPLNTTLYVSDFKGNEPKFLRYLLQTVNFQAYSDKGAVPGINRNHLHEALVKVPSIQVQRTIAHILGTLDDKIELNRRMNETLEAMARTIFQSWFVDFDPVRAKASGESADSICHRLGLTPELLALFPDSFEDSELGEIPNGWRVGALEEVLVFQRGFDLPTPNRIPGKYPVLAASGPSGTHHECMVPGPGLTTGRSGVLGKVFYVHEDYWPLNTSLWVKEFRKARPAYAFHLLRGLDFSGLNAGSAVPTLNRNHAHAMRVLIPPMTLVNSFEPKAVMFLTQQHSNSVQSDVLSALRDSLLPQLLSGELKVPKTKA